MKSSCFPGSWCSRRATRLGVRFTTLTLQQELDFVQSTFSRADAWTDWTKGRRTDTPLRGLAHVLRIGVGGIFQLFGHIRQDAGHLARRRASKLEKARLDAGS